MAVMDETLRLIEALVFMAAEPVSERALARRLPPGTSVRRLLERLAADYAGRGIELRRAGDTWAFQTAADLGPRLDVPRAEEGRLSRAAVETLAIIAYHQPVTRAEIEQLRGVQLSKGTLDALLQLGWIAPKGRRSTPGRPLLWGTTEPFLRHFGLTTLADLPDLAELQAVGLGDREPRVLFALPAADLGGDRGAAEQ
jgi:segregation and condensation protein B